MPRVSLRTLILMLELLVAVLAWQYLTLAAPVNASAIWMAGDCHTASSLQERVAGPAPAPVAAVEGTRGP